jgi:hypothetical protein
MDQIAQQFNLLGLAALAVMVVVLSTFTRKALELAMPWLVKEESQGPNIKVVRFQDGVGVHFYNELGLYLIPYVWAAVAAITKSEFLFGDVDSYIGRLFLSVFVATFSALFYKSVKKKIPTLFGVTVEDNDDKVLPVAKRE